MVAPGERCESDDVLIGTRLGDRYELSALIGRGGMASVYRATDTALGREVAVKAFVAAEAIDHPERRRSEIELLASLTHPALVTVHDAARDARTGQEFLVMELVDGPNLSEHLRTRGPLGAADAARMVSDLSEALHAIHERGIVHRDLKPANVLLAPSALPSPPWRAKLADFGIARLVDDSRLTATGMLVGTPGYVSPEQVRGERPTTASDVYALGLLALEARTGEQAFPGPGFEAASARLVRDPELPEGLGRDWRELIAAMTARDPAERPTALEVANRIGSSDADRPVALLPAGARPTAPTVAFSTSGRTAPATDRTAPTKVLTGGFDTVVHDEPSGSAASSTPDHARNGRVAGVPRRVRRRALAALAAAALVIAALAVAMTLIRPTNGDEPPPSPLPAVPGELGVHLEQLEEAVTP